MARRAVNLQAVYDLRCSPPTYDSVGFAVASEMERQRQLADGIDFHILPGPSGGFRADRLPPFTIAEREQMRDQIVVPIFHLLPSCRSVTVHNERSKPGKFGFEERHYGFPEMLAAAKAGVYPLRDPLEHPRVDAGYITITLRESDYWPTRNSNIPEWLKVIEWLRNIGHRVIVVRETAKAWDVVGYGIEHDPNAALKLRLRANLYANAELNLFVNNGPAWVAMFLGAPCMIFKMTAPNAGVATDAAFRQYGLPRGSRWPNARPRQEIVWTDDDSASVIAAIENVLCVS